MRRKYDLRNKKSFIIILVLAIAIIVIFSLFIYKYSKASKIEYKIEAGAILQDVDKNYVSIDDDALLKIRWNDTYYLVYKDKKINLGKKVIVYNSITGAINLYGTFYEIASDGKIIEHKPISILPNSLTTKFYKIDDREYLIVDKEISSRDKSIKAGNYLLVELDKAGNAKLSNDKLNLKTITPTVLVTAEYSFDIANEILNFGEFDIDLKKIIGSTNQYKPEGEDGSGGGGGSGDGDGDGTGTGTGTGTGSGNGDGDGNGNGSGSGEGDGNGGTGGGGSGIGSGEAGGPGDIINNGGIGNAPSLDEIMDKLKTTSVISIVQGMTHIEFNYFVYDPYNEYKNVYVEVIGNGESNKVYLNKMEHYYKVDGLLPNTDYELVFMYTTMELNSETGEKEETPTTFDSFELTTKMPQYSIGIQKVSTISKKLTYRVMLQNGYNVDRVIVKLNFKYNELLKNPETGELVLDEDGKVIEVTKNAYIEPIETAVTETDLKRGYVEDTFDISGYSDYVNVNTKLTLTIDRVKTGEFELPINVSNTFNFGR